MDKYNELAKLQSVGKAMRQEGYQITAGYIERAATHIATLDARIEALEGALQGTPIIGGIENALSFKTRQDKWLATEYKAALGGEQHGE